MLLDANGLALPPFKKDDLFVETFLSFLSAEIELGLETELGGFGLLSTGFG